MDFFIIIILLIILALVSIKLGYTLGENAGIDKGYDYGYEDGYNEAKKLENIKLERVPDDFPTTLDGKFFSTDAAIRQISKVGED